MLKRLLLHPTSMQTIQKQQVSFDGSYDFIKVGVGWSTWSIQVNNEI
jgi:hypothetical protein